MSIISVKNIHKIYNEKTVPVHALQGVDLEIEAGEFTAIVGPSGSGKTTLLNIIGGLDRPNQGQVRLADTALEDLNDNQLIDFRKNNIGFIFQAYNLIPVLTSQENVEFVMLLQNRPKAEMHKRAVDLLKSVGLEDKLNQRPSQLSGGQQQRVAVARAVASKPKFVLADEPTANLDSKSTADLLDIMARLNKEENITFVFSTHDSRVIERARRVVNMIDGKIESDEQQAV